MIVLDAEFYSLSNGARFDTGHRQKKTVFPHILPSEKCSFKKNEKETFHQNVERFFSMKNTFYSLLNAFLCDKNGSYVNRNTFFAVPFDFETLSSRFKTVLNFNRKHSQPFHQLLTYFPFRSFFG